MYKCNEVLCRGTELLYVRHRTYSNSCLGLEPGRGGNFVAEPAVISSPSGLSVWSVWSGL